MFNGTDGRKPVGMAEVSLTIGGVGGEYLTKKSLEGSSGDGFVSPAT